MYTTFKKSGQEKQRNRRIAGQILSNFFIADPEQTPNLVPEIDQRKLEKCFSVESQKLVSELVEKTRKYERMLNPSKKYFLSEKMKMVNPSISKNNSRRIIEFVTDLTKNGEHVSIGGFYSDSQKFFQLKQKSPNRIRPEQANSDEDARIRTESREQGPAEENSENGRSKQRRKMEEPSGSEESRESRKKSGLDREFMETINRSSTELSVWKENCEETRVDFAGELRHLNRSFFGYYNFHNFFNHFVILYERLKFMKSLTDPHGVFDFMKIVMFLVFTGVLDFEFFEDVIGCLLFEYSGVFLNLERILSNVVKEIPSHEIDRFVIDINSDLFQSTENIQLDSAEPHLPGKLASKGYPSGRNREEWLFVKTCHKLSSLTFKNKANCKQSQIQSYINNNNLVNDHLLKFEFRTREQVFVIHKIRSLFKHGHKKVQLL